MKYFNIGKVVSFGIVCVSFCTEAAVLDIWQVTQKSVKPSTVLKADGTVTTIDPAQEVLLEIQLKSKVSYGNSNSRDIKFKEVVPATDSAPGSIKVDIQTDLDRKCHASSQGGLGLIGSVGPASARLPIVLKPGIYRLLIDSVFYGMVTVTQSEASIAEDTNYKLLAQQRVNFETQKVFGNLNELSIQAKNCSVNLSSQQNELVADYKFPSTQETLANGDIIIRKAVEGSAKLSRSQISSTCDSDPQKPETAEITWTLRLTGENAARLSIQKFKSGSTEYVSIGFAVEGKTCSKSSSK